MIVNFQHPCKKCGSSEGLICQSRGTVECVQCGLVQVPDFGANTPEELAVPCARCGGKLGSLSPDDHLCLCLDCAFVQKVVVS